MSQHPRLPDDELPAIAVGILSFNRVEEVLRSLEAFVESDYPADRLNLFVIDNGSSDGTREAVLERFGDRVGVVRFEENRGAIARNEVVLGRGERYAFHFDEDCTPADRDTLRRAVEIMEASPEIGALCFRSINQYTGAGEWGDFRRTARRRHGTWGYEGIFVIGNGMCYRTAMVRHTRGYDPRIFWGAEELQLALELLHHEVPVVYVPSLALIHRHAPRVMARASVVEIDTRNNIIIAFTYLPLPVAALFASLQVARRLLVAIVRRPEDGLEAVVRGIRRGLGMLPEVLADRRIIPMARLAEYNRWFFASFTGLPPAPSEPEDPERIARSPRAPGVTTQPAMYLESIAPATTT